ncbi:MAG: hypothetical protein K2I81_01020 [Alphaproteobacteria bacterium]|nr:hypothetical protein [Alphaproteobacteria bacterium]
MNIKTVLCAVAILISTTFGTNALTLNPGTGFQPIVQYTCQKASACNGGGAGYSVSNLTRGTNCATTGYVYYTAYCSSCGATLDPTSGGSEMTACYKITSCTSCPSGYTLTDQTEKPSDCQTQFAGYTYKTCCGTCSNCSDSAWTTVSGNIKMQQRTKRTCDCGTCKDTGTEYRCTAGYYGPAISSTSTCSRCPSQGTSETGNNSRITSCYITSGSDTSGSYSFESPCYYSQSFTAE